MPEPKAPQTPRAPEGLLLREAPAHAGHGWEVVVVTREKPFAGVGDSAEEALLATLDHLLIRFEAYLGEAIDSGKVTSRQGLRVQALARRFHGQIGELFTQVYPEAQREGAIRRLLTLGDPTPPSADHSTVLLGEDEPEDDLLG